jgi:signal transduction protein with GAF and PtsI domain
MRLMDDYVAGRQAAMSYATWETKLHKKDKIAQRKRMEGKLAEDGFAMGQQAKMSRRVKLTELYAEDDKKYEAELLDLNLAFRRDKI